jgi:hypothetical protein
MPKSLPAAMTSSMSMETEGKLTNTPAPPGRLPPEMAPVTVKPLNNTFVTLIARTTSMATSPPSIVVVVGSSPITEMFETSWTCSG